MAFVSGTDSTRPPARAYTRHVGGVGRIGNQRHISHIQQTEMNEEKAFAGPQEGYHLGVWIQIDPEAPLLPARNRLLQWFQRVEAGIVMVLRTRDGFSENVEEMLWGRHIRIAKAKVDHVLALCPHLGQDYVHLGPEVGVEGIEPLGSSDFATSQQVIGFERSCP